MSFWKPKNTILDIWKSSIYAFGIANNVLGHAFASWAFRQNFERDVFK